MPGPILGSAAGAGPAASASSTGGAAMAAAESPSKLQNSTTGGIHHDFSFGLSMWQSQQYGRTEA